MFHPWKLFSIPPWLCSQSRNDIWTTFLSLCWWKNMLFIYLSHQVTLHPIKWAISFRKVNLDEFSHTGLLQSIQKTLIIELIESGIEFLFYFVNLLLLILLFFISFFLLHDFQKRWVYNVLYIWILNLLRGNFKMRRYILKMKHQNDKESFF